MRIINTLFIDIIVLLFPLMANLVYSAHSRNMNRERKNTFLDFSLISSVYLFYNYCLISNTIDLIVLINIPLIIAFFNRRSFISIFISLILINAYHFIFDMPVTILFIEYVIYYFIYLLTFHNKKRNKLIIVLFMINNFIFTCINLYISHSDLVKTFRDLFTLIVFIALTYLVVYIFKMSDDIIKLNNSIKELEKETQIRDSLFKITHEIKNPIAVCKTYLDMFDFSNKEHERYIPIIKEEIDKTLLLLQDFLSMNKIKLNKELLDINLLLNDVSSQFDIVMRSMNINFLHEIDENEIFVEGDYNRLNQVLTNVIKNSIEAMDEDKSPSILLQTSIVNEKIEITITDNGIGIPKEHLERIREPFYTTKKNGTGLGVSLSYNIMEAHGGSIIYNSIEGQGTTVKLILPLVFI